jgi:murein L,D-transpeptidase YafK
MPLRDNDEATRVLGKPENRGNSTLKYRPFVRPLLASAAIAAALLVAGCETDSTSNASLRSLQPLSPQMIAEVERRNMSKESPILVRLFKEESELEVWKQDREGRYALLKTYPICRWSGELGPKIKEGDRQAPEGFYTITPSLMNPNSSYYLAINMGFPNAFDKSNGRTGAFLMIHGDCSSRGCYAMTDEQIAEIYALARESFFGGQRAFQIQAYPFRMTALNMAKHRDSPHMSFWRMLKQGNDHFEVTRLEPKVDVCDKRYVFDAEGNGRFTPAGKCPAYQVNEDIVAAVKEKQQRDDQQMAEYVRRGTPTVPVVTRTDGGMHPTFLAAFEKPHTDSAGIVRSAAVSLPGTIPPYATPPRGTETATGSVTDSSARTTRVATAQPATQQSSSGGWFGNLFSSNGTDQSNSGGVLDRMSRLVGLKETDTASDASKRKANPPTKSTAAPAKAKAQAEPKEPKQNAGAIRPPPARPDRQDAPATPDRQEVAAAPEQRPTSSAGLLNGAQPTVPAGSFDNRWGSFR